MDEYSDDEAGTFFGLHYPFANSNSLSSRAAAPPACAQLLRADVARMQTQLAAAAGANSGANSAAQAARRAASEALDALVGEMSDDTYIAVYTSSKSTR